MVGQTYPAGANLSVGWHTFGLSWTRSRIVWFIDGQKVLTIGQHVPHQRMYFIANLAETRHPHGGLGCTGTMLIRSVKVWQH
jgi:beta-glucanase (GH16 family)